MAGDCIIVEGDLRVGRQELACARKDQRVDLHELRILRHQCPIEAAHDGGDWLVVR